MFNSGNPSTSSFSLSGMASSTGPGGGGGSNSSSLFGSGTPNASTSGMSSSIFGQQQQQQQPQNLMQSTNGMTHSQSTLDLTSSPYGSRHVATTPSWGKHDRRKVPSHISTLRPQSSFTPDRNAIGTPGSRHGSISAAQSPPNTFSGSFGTAKPVQAKKSNIIDEEDLPPTESIYDTGASPFFSGGSTPLRESVKPMAALPTSNTAIGLRRMSSNSSKPSPPANTPPDVQETQNANCSVIVFGFPPTLTSTIIKHFSKFGPILENFDVAKGESPRKSGRAPPIQTGPNWMKLTYDNPTSAAKAVSHYSGGSRFIGGCAIGCMPFNSVNAKEFGYASTNSTITESEDAEADDELMDLDSPHAEKKQIQQDANNRPVPRTISMPALGQQQSSTTPNSRRIQIKDGSAIFNNKQRPMRHAPSMGNMQSKNVDGGLKSARQGWLSWTKKRAQDLVFGWDGL
ncbi:hypothetical protein TRICI_001285 [Trichomonascus ciferrii]|uniref:RRM Nup35-type domain-containing protein n=1 Tax=Trichomonascus ciferrii TaxID=44093 RepID=A0A642VA31_9ASCO|nr:hypothetical protein TRICI_001285 [Trichomonascus ciferrii]